MADGDAEPRPNPLRTLAESLWFPLLFFFGFLLCYMLPFHAPAPHDLKVAVSGPAASASIGGALAQKAPGAFDIIPVTDAETARQRVLDREVLAAYTVVGDRATLYLAKANGAPLEQVVIAAFTQAAAQGGQQLSTVELAPTASGDVTGTGLFYLALVWNIAPYIAVMMLMRAVSLSRRAKLLTIAGLGAFMSVVGYTVGVAISLVPHQPLAMLYGFMLTQAIAWTTYGLAPFARQFLPGVAITLFVLLSIPSSGGAIPYQLVPGFFRALHPVMPLGNLIDALHGIFYFDNQGLLRPTLVLCAWLATGAVLLGGGILLERHRERQEASEGTSAEEQVEQPVEDPSLEAPAPHALRPGSGEHFGAERPMLAGSVRMTDGSPVPHALVTVLAPGGRQLMRTTTDEKGRYAATGLPEDFATVVLLTRGHDPAATQIFPRAGHVLRQDFVLTESGSSQPE